MKKLPKGAIIEITFPPDNYKVIPSPPVCGITGSINYFESCILTGTTIRIVTAEVQRGTNVVVTIEDVPNPDLGITQPFVIETFYDET